MKKLILLILLLPLCLPAFAQNKPGTGAKIIKLEAGEKWFGGSVNDGTLMPFRAGYSYNLYGNNKGNQASPLFLSTKGRYIWSDQPFEFTVNADKLIISKAMGKVAIEQSGTTLAQAFRGAAKSHFPASGTMPDSLLFTRPQYNTWIELVYNQNQEDILKYAHSIIDNGFPPGVLMIDDNWMDYYGKFSFRKDRFPDAKKMMAELHRLGFKVMVWICPFISSDTQVFRQLLADKLLLLDNKGDTALTWQKAQSPAIISWWNGYSAEMDFTNPAAVKWYRDQLNLMTTDYGVDGFKFDAGDMEYYPANAIPFKKATPNGQCEMWGQFAQFYPLNEYRAMWKRGGQPLAERLRDKAHSWADLRTLVPNAISGGLLGYQYICPDMIGGGEFGSFIGLGKLDQELLVRSAQCAALMPMMQFSVAPWRVLDPEHLEAVKKAVAIRQKLTPYLFKLIKASAISGEPVARSLEYEFPNQGYDTIKNQFMAGSRYMVAPMLEKGEQRKVVFPKGRWKSVDNKVIQGPVIKEITVPLDVLPVFERLN